MPSAFFSDLFLSLRWVVRWGLLTLPVGLATGSACALFLWSLDRVTDLRFRNPSLLYALPLAGVAIGWVYSRWGESAERGNNLIMDEIHEPGGGVPLRMAPLVLFGTLATHLFGGSAGREGTAVQMGGSLAQGFARLVPGLSAEEVRILLMTGIAAGFSGVFGTPIAGTVFALEVLSIGRISHAALVPCLIASLVSDRTCLAWGIGHTHYPINSMADPASAAAHPLGGSILAAAALIGALSGLASALFSELTHGLHEAFRRLSGSPLVRPFLGGLIVIGLTFLVENRDSLGLGVSSPDPAAVTIVRCFEPGGAHLWSWLWKLLFTAVTLASGFKGGEVTPLFFIGASLGNVIATALGLPVDMLAALGFAAVFAGATNTPLACTLMGIELFGSGLAVPLAVACCLAYVASGHTGIYLSQRITAPKVPGPAGDIPPSLKAERERRRERGRRAVELSRDGAADPAEQERKSPPPPEEAKGS